MKMFLRLAAFACLAIPSLASAQQATVQSGPDIRALQAHFMALQTAISDVVQDVDAAMRAMQKQLQDDEAQKATLIEWLQKAQAEAAPKAKK